MFAFGRKSMLEKWCVCDANRTNGQNRMRLGTKRSDFALCVLSVVACSVGFGYSLIFISRLERRTRVSERMSEFINFYIRIYMSEQKIHVFFFPRLALALAHSSRAYV